MIQSFKVFFLFFLYPVLPPFKRFILDSYNRKRDDKHPDIGVLVHVLGNRTNQTHQRIKERGGGGHSWLGTVRSDYRYVTSYTRESNNYARRIRYSCDHVILSCQACTIC